MKKNIFNEVKLFFLNLAKARASVRQIAWGASIGTFISVFPTFGLGMPLVILLSRVFKFNLVAAIALSVVSNPFTSPFFMLSSYKVGALITGSTIEFSLNNWRENLKTTGLSLLLGSFIISGTLAVIAYFMTSFIVTRIRKNQIKKYL